ncbi:AMED_5909 family protein [Actinophytocola xanthii]|uniref:AMED_5909 family protein n=1 Tax=Actinophytocola xanthii TaxID=1912961 RepID=UPI001E2FD222|nr:AMED_5909 family protein [Actinophytocola xanthii]
MTSKRSKPVLLMEAHELLTRERPSSGASSHVWLSYYRRSATVYKEVAETDRGHHHEALYWASREERKAHEIEESLRKRRK